MIDPKKYVTFNRAELYQVLGEFGADPTLQANVQLCELADAVVLRKQDLFASAGLYAYSHTLSTVIEVTKTMQADEGIIEQLEELRDYFAQQADQAYAISNHVPVNDGE
jgi:hypothetical protein